MFEYTYEINMKRYVIWKHDGMKCEAILVTNTEDKARKATTLYEKYGAGILRYPVK